MAKEENNLPTVHSVPVLLEKIEARLASMTKAQNRPSKTHGDFNFYPRLEYNSGYYVDIHICSNIETLLECLGHLANKFAQFNEAQKYASDKLKSEYGVNLQDVKAFTWQDYTYEAWEHDILHRIYLVTCNNEFTELNEAKKSFSALLSREDQVTQLVKKLGLE